jgi:hypothetical protein
VVLVIIVECDVVVQKNRGRWRKGYIPLKAEDLERLRIFNTGKTPVLLFLYRKGEAYDGNKMKVAKATFDKIEIISNEIAVLKEDIKEDFK